MAAGLGLLFRPRFARLGRALPIAGLVLLAVLSNSFVSKRLLRPLQARYPAVPELAAGAPLPPGSPSTNSSRRAARKNVSGTR